MSHRPLPLVAGLTLGDYLLWNSSVGGGSSVLAMISGLTLVPLALATAWLLALTIARVLVRGARPRTTQPRQAATRTRSAAAPSVAPLRAGAVSADRYAENAQATAATASSGKIAA